MLIYELEDYVLAHKEEITASKINEDSHFYNLFDMSVKSIEKNGPPTPTVLNYYPNLLKILY